MSAQERLNQYIVGIIRRERQERGWTVAELSCRAGIPIGSYSCIEVGNRYRLGLLNLLRLQLALQMPITDLWPPVGLKAERVTGNILSAVLSDAEEQLPVRVTVEGIIEAVCEEFQFTLEQLAGPSRERRYARARCLAAALARQTPGLTLQSVSRAFNRHYATLYRSLEHALEDPEFWDRLRRIEERLKGKNLQDTSGR